MLCCAAAAQPFHFKWPLWRQEAMWCDELTELPKAFNCRWRQLLWMQMCPAIDRLCIPAVDFMLLSLQLLLLRVVGR